MTGLSCLYIHVHHASAVDITLQDIPQQYQVNISDHVTTYMSTLNQNFNTDQDELEI